MNTQSNKQSHTHSPTNKQTTTHELRKTTAKQRANKTMITQSHKTLRLTQPPSYNKQAEKKTSNPTNNQLIQQSNKQSSKLSHKQAFNQSNTQPNKHKTSKQQKP
jgi:hypothetical protein